MAESFTFTAEESGFQTPMAVLRAGTKIVAKIYLSPDGKVLRFALPELATAEQIKTDLENQIIDFRRGI